MDVREYCSLRTSASFVFLIQIKHPSRRHKRFGSDPWGWGDPLEEGMVTQSSILAWRILWTEEPGGLWSIGLQRARQY